MRRVLTWGGYLGTFALGEGAAQMSIRKIDVTAALAGGAAAAMLGIGVAHADEGTDVINGWTVTPTNASDSGVSGIPATLSDPSDSLGLGTTPISGGFDSAPAVLSSIGSNDLFTTPLSVAGTPDSLLIQDNWGPGFEFSSVQAGAHNDVLAFLVPAADGNQVVDLFNFGTLDAPPLFNPDATAPIDIGGVQLASPHDGALLNNLVDALFLGDTADWAKAATLFDAWTGIDPSGGAGGAAAAASGGMAADDASGATTSSDDLLSTAVTDFTDAKTVLSSIDVSDAPSQLQSSLSGYITDQTAMLNTDVSILNDYVGPAESTVLTDSGPLSTVVDQWFFEPLNQDWAADSKALLTADQGLDTAVASGLQSDITSALQQVLAADSHNLLTEVESMPLYVLGVFLGDGSGAAAGASPGFFDLPFGLFGL